MCKFCFEIESYDRNCVVSGSELPNGMVPVGKMNEGVEIYVAQFIDTNSDGEEINAFGYYYPAGGLHTEGGYYEYSGQGKYAATMKLLIVF